MSLHQRQAEFITRYSILPDPHERLSALTSRRSNLDPLPPEERVDEMLVKGCVSRVWLAGRMENGRCRFRLYAESVMVRGLATILCELYDDAPPEEIVEMEPEIFDVLGISRNLSPTRLNGLAQLRGRIAGFARSQLS